MPSATPTAVICIVASVPLTDCLFALVIFSGVYSADVCDVGTAEKQVANFNSHYLVLSFPDPRLNYL